MLGRLKAGITYANVASTMAILIAIGGGGVAVAATLVPKNSVGTKQIINNSVKSADLKDNSVTSADLLDNGVAGVDLKDNSVTGADVNESSLGKVPSAANADRANGLSSGAITDPNVFGTGRLGVVRAYAWNSSASANANLTNNGYTYNRSGGAVNVVHTSAGVYTITFAGLSLNGGNVVVSGYGSGANWCKVSGWGSSSIGVLCFSSAGAPTDSLWTIAVAE